MNVLRKKRLRMINDGEQGEYIPTTDDINHKRELMEWYLSQLRVKRQENIVQKRIATRDVQMSMVKEQVLDLQDKFDFFILAMLKNGQINLAEDDNNHLSKLKDY